MSIPFLCIINRIYNLFFSEREFNSLQGNVHLIYFTKNKSFIRTLVWSKILSAKQNENGKPTDDAQTEKPILKILTPNVKEQEIKASDVKIVLENVKEQSLNKEATAADTLKQIKEKIFDIKPKEGEQDKGIYYDVT